MQGLTVIPMHLYDKGPLSFLSLGRGFSAAENPLYLRMTLSDAGFVGMHPIGDRRIRKLRAAQRAKRLAGNLSPRRGGEVRSVGGLSARHFKKSRRGTSRSNVQSERVVYRAHLRCAAGAGVQGVYGSGASEATGGDERFPRKMLWSKTGGARLHQFLY